MAIDSARSIEVFKSPQPQYFGNAFGVINIVPKRKAEEGYTTKTQVAFGSYDTIVAKAEHGGKTSGWDYCMGGGYRASDGHRDNSDGELNNAYGRLGRQLNDNWNVSLFAMWNDNYADDPGAEGADPDAREGRYETRAVLSTLTLSHDYERFSGEIKGYRGAGEGDWLDQPTDTEGVREDLYNDFLYYGIKGQREREIGQWRRAVGGSGLGLYRGRLYPGIQRRQHGCLGWRQF